MTVTLELKPEVQASLAEKASKRGMSLDDYLKAVLEADAEAAEEAPEERLERINRTLDKLAEIRKNAPAIPASALTREAMYRDHD